MVLSWREVFFLGSPESYARMGRGGDAERCKSLTREETFVSEAISDECAAKLLLFFDMAMACPGLRALLVRISCNQASGYRGYPGYLGYPTCVFFLKLWYI